MKHLVINSAPDEINWETIPEITDFSCPWYPGAIPFTSVKICCNKDYLYIRFSAECSSILLYEKDGLKDEVLSCERVEVFFATNADLQPYYCLEVDAKGRIFDCRANHYRQFDYNWEWPSGLTALGEFTNSGYQVDIIIPLQHLHQLNLIQEGKLRVGLFRAHCLSLIDKHATFRWISWMQPATEKPDFHVPSAFEEMVLPFNL